MIILLRIVALAIGALLLFVGDKDGKLAPKDGKQPDQVKPKRPLLPWRDFQPVASIGGRDSEGLACDVPAEIRQWFRNPDGSCLHPHTRIDTTNGPVPVCQLDPAKDQIFYHAKDGQRRATNNYKAFVTKKAVTFSLVGGILCTPDHLIAVRGVNRLVYGLTGEQYDYKPAALLGETGVTLASPLDVWDIANGEECWKGEGNFFANGLLVHNCVQCSISMAAVDANYPVAETLLFDTEYGPRVRGGSYPQRVAQYAQARGMRVYNVTGTVDETIAWMKWACRTGRGCAIGAGSSHFQTLFGYDEKAGRWYVVNNNSPQKVDVYDEAAFRRLHAASGPWLVVLDVPVRPAVPAYVNWWE